MTVAVTPEAPAEDADAARSVDELARAFETKQAAYLSKLKDYLPNAYRQRLSTLSVEQFQEVATTLRRWEFYTANGPSPMGDYRYQKDGRFREQFLKPMDKVAELLLIEPAKISDSEIAIARADLVSLGEQLAEARREQGINIDPTVGVKSPTGIEYPQLTKPHNCLDQLAVYEETIVLAYTVASAGARPLLLDNAKLCTQVDIEEARFTMYANQVRMLSGTVAWTVDPLLTACARDHSIDRAAGRAKSHTSSVPGKKTLADRAKRFGTRVGSEGAGGGTDGVKSVYGFSYNGAGHANPLYSTRMNVVGPGQHKGNFTAMYAKDNSLLHACPATTGELFMPPGISARDLKSSELRNVYKAFKARKFAKAHQVLEKAEPAKEFEKAMHRYFAARVEAEVAWALNGVERTLAAGDAYAASIRLKDAQNTLSGIPAFDQSVEPIIDQFKDEQVQAEIKAGKIFYAICQKAFTQENLNELTRRYPDSLYAEAAKFCTDFGLQKMKGYDPLLFFSLRDPALNEWGYLVKVLN